MLVFDATAIEALFRGHPVLFQMLLRADEGKTTLIFPALCVVEAGAALKMTSSTSWEMYLWLPNVQILPLEQGAAVEISSWELPSLGARQALWEAQRINCPLVTREAGLYGPDQAVIVQV